MCLEDKLEAVLDVVDRLVDQNARLSSRITALQNMSAFLMAELFIDKAEPEWQLNDLTTEISGTALAIADQLRPLSSERVPGLREVSQTMEKVCQLAEFTLHAKVAPKGVRAQLRP